jgi:hypothetical protein
MGVEAFPAEVQGMGQKKLGVQPGAFNLVLVQMVGCPIQNFQDRHLYLKRVQGF